MKRSTTSGGPYTQISAPTSTSFTDTGLTNGTAYFYAVSALNTAGESPNSTQATATPTAPASAPPAPTGLQATAGNAQVSLAWSASTGATSYHVKRSTTSGGAYTQISAPASTNFTDTGLSNGTAYFYVVSALNTAGESANSTQASATPTNPITAAIQVTVDALSNRHAISPYVYGVNFPANAAYITDSGATLIRWGGNASTRYNWKNFDTSAASDWYFSNRPFGNAGDPLYNDSTQFVSNVSAAGGYPIMTIGMLPWAAKDASSYSFSVSKYGAQCATNPYSADDGNGVKTDCSTNVTGNDPHDANIALLDGPPASGDPAGSVYRNEWVSALSSAYPSTRPHFYDMDNEVDIWGGTHRDVHPAPSGYNELRDTYLRIAAGMRTWDPQAVRFGPVSCCWWFYWNGANGNDKTAHAGLDFLPWWLNEVYWSDLISGNRSVDVLDIHAYPDQPDNFSNFTTAQKQAAAVRIFRDYWDPTYTSESSDINQPWTTQIQPLKTIAFRIPRMRAMANMIYPGTPLSITEWNAAFAGESDFSTAIADADAFGIFGRERVTYAARWTAADSTAPAYQSLKMFRNYDGNHSTFGVTSISATHTADPNLFSVYAALSASQTSMTLLVLNKDPANTANVGFTLNNFTPSSAQAFTLSSSTPTAIVASASKSWSSVQSFAPYSVTLLVVSGKLTSTPAAAWDLNPDAIQVAAGSTAHLVATNCFLKRRERHASVRAIRFGLNRRRHHFDRLVANRLRHRRRDYDRQRHNSRFLPFHRHRAGQRRRRTKAGRLARRRKSRSHARKDRRQPDRRRRQNASAQRHAKSRLVRRHKFRRQYSLRHGCRQPKWSLSPNRHHKYFRSRRRRLNPAREWRHSARHSGRPLRPRPPRSHLHRNRPIASTQTPHPIHATPAIP